TRSARPRCRPAISAATAANAAGSASSGLMSRNSTPGVGKSGTSRIRARISSPTPPAGPAPCLLTTPPHPPSCPARDCPDPDPTRTEPAPACPAPARASPDPDPTCPEPNRACPGPDRAYPEPDPTCPEPNSACHEPAVHTLNPTPHALVPTPRRARRSRRPHTY